MSTRTRGARKAAVVAASLPLALWLMTTACQGTQIVSQPPGVMALTARVLEDNGSEGTADVVLEWINPGHGSVTAIEVNWALKEEGLDADVDEELLPDASEYQVQELEQGRSYIFGVATRNGNGLVSDMESAVATPRAAPPAEVSGLVARPGDEEITLRWSDPGDPDFSHVRLRYGTNNTADTDFTGTADSAGTVIDGLSNGTLYTIEIATVDTTGNVSSGLSTSARPRAVVLDALVANAGSRNRSHVNYGVGRAAFEAVQAISNEPAASTDLAIADFDGDGITDVFITNARGPNRVYLGEGGGVFRRNEQLGGASRRARAVALGDLDGDGNMDAFVANGEEGGGQANSLYLGNGDGSFAAGVDVGPSHDSRDVALGDLNGDGNLDAVVVNGGTPFGAGEPNQVYLGDGSGGFSSISRLGGGSGTDARSLGIALGDLDDDGNLDAFVANDFSTQDRVYLGDGSGSFAAGAAAWSDIYYSSDAALADFNGDGNPDVFVTVDGDTNLIASGDGTGGFDVPRPASLDQHKSTSVAVGDLDGDGNLDAFVTNRGTVTNRIFFGDGDGGFRPTTQAASDQRDISTGVAIGEF